MSGARGNDITERKGKEESFRKSQTPADTVRKEREQVLREVLVHILRLQDEERRRIGRDLHDTTGQTLSALKMALASFERSGGEISKAPDQFNEITILADQALQEVRSLSHLLHPPLLDEVGLSAAASWYVEGFGKRSGIESTLECAELPKFNKEAELAFFRVLQESLTNVLRHSGSKKVHVRIHSNGHKAALLIKDYGRGIPAEQLTKFDQMGGGVGLSGMKARLRALGGNLRIQCDGTGTCVTATLPLNGACQINTEEDLRRVNQPAPIKFWVERA